MLSVGPSICINFFGVDKYFCLISLQYMVGKGLTALDVSESRAITWTVTNGPFGNTVEFGSSKVPPQNHYNNTFWTEVVPSAKSPTGKRKKTDLKSANKSQLRIGWKGRDQMYPTSSHSQRGLQRNLPLFGRWRWGQNLRSLNAARRCQNSICLRHSGKLEISRSASIKVCL